MEKQEILYTDEFGAVYNMLKKSIVKMGECTGQSSYTVKSGTEIIEKYCFKSSDLVEINLPDSVQIIEEGAFTHCSKLATLNVGKGLVMVKYSAFQYSTNLKHIHFPESLTTLKPYVFYNCSGNLRVSFEPGNQHFCSDSQFVYSKDKSKITHVVDNYKNKYLTIPDGVVEIAKSAFANTIRIIKVQLGNDVKKIGDFAFCGSGLKEIVLSKSLEIIGESCFKYVPIEQLTIPENVHTIGKSAFAECESLISIDVHPENRYFKSVNGILYTKKLNNLILYPCNISFTSFKIPSTVTKISARAFYGAYNLNEVKLSKNLEVIEEEAFYCCWYLSKISWTSKLKRIKKKAFVNCSTLTKLILPESLKYIDEGAFSFCKSLEYVYIPKNILKIKKEAFLNYQDIIFKIHKNNPNYLARDNRIYEKRENIHYSEYWFGGNYDPNAPF